MQLLFFAKIMHNSRRFMNIQQFFTPIFICKQNVNLSIKFLKSGLEIPAQIYYNNP